MISNLGMRGELSLVDTVGLNSSGVYAWAVIIAGIFVLIALALSTFLIFEHLSWYNNPEEQKWLIGVILIVPLYATESFVSLYTTEAALEWEILRDCYEAFALYSFGRYLVACLGGEDKTIQSMERQAIAGPQTPLLLQRSGKAAVKHLFPLNYCLKPWGFGKEFYQAFKFGIVQYMILKTVCALLSLVLEWWNLFGEGEFAWDKGYPYIAAVINFSQCWALYCLIQFYNMTKEELAPIQPLAKFLCFKSIVFLTWWQGLVIAIIFSIGAFKTMFADSLQSRIQDFIICIEMGFAAVCHVYVFPAKPYQIMGPQKRGSVSVLSDYASIDSSPDLQEVRDAERHSIMRLHCPSVPDTGTSLKESMHDVVFKGGEYLVNDVKFTVDKFRAPVEKGFSRLNETFHHIKENMRRNEKGKKKRVKDDSWVHSMITGIDDPFLTGSLSDSGTTSRKKHKYTYTYNSADSSGESSDQGVNSHRHQLTMKE